MSDMTQIKAELDVVLSRMSQTMQHALRELALNRFQERAKRQHGARLRSRKRKKEE